jgi:hypothetical protein
MAEEGNDWLRKIDAAMSKEQERRQAAAEAAARHQKAATTAYDYFLEKDLPAMEEFLVGAAKELRTRQLLLEVKPNAGRTSPEATREYELVFRVSFPADPGGAYAQARVHAWESSGTFSCEIQIKPINYGGYTGSEASPVPLSNLTTAWARKTLEEMVLDALKVSRG